MNIKEIRNIIINYIENNKVKGIMSYSESLIEADTILKELMVEIYKEYIEIMKNEEEC